MTHFTYTKEGYVALSEIAQFDGGSKEFNLRLKDGRVVRAGATDPGDTRIQMCLTNDWERLYYDPEGGDLPYFVEDVVAFTLTASGEITSITPSDLQFSSSDTVVLRRKGTEPIYESDTSYPNLEAWLESKARAKS